MPEPLFEVEEATARRDAAGGEPAAPGGRAADRKAGERADIVLRVHVQPAAGRATVVGRYGDSLHIRVAAPPVGGRANAAAAELVAELLDVKVGMVELASGERSRAKRFRVRDVEVLEAGRRLDEAVADAAAGPLGRRREPRSRGR